MNVARSMLTSNEIESIINQKNLVLRNLQVTQGYYRLARGLRNMMSTRNVNWLVFATHASKTAGQALRHELLPKPLKSLMIRVAGFDNTHLYLNDALRATPQAESRDSRLAAALLKVSNLVSAGNLLVFIELSTPFMLFIKTFANDWSYDEEKISAFLKVHLRPGPFEKGGQDYLKEAFDAFYKARFETNDKRKSEYILRANLLIGVHEQTHLQPYIKEALAVPLEVFIDAEATEESADGQVGGISKRLQKKTTEISRELVLKAATRMWMSFSLPTRDLRLGKDVVAPTGMMNFPAELIAIEDSRTKELVALFDTSLNTLSGSAASNWGNLADRMSFVVDFFRSYQQYKKLFDPPFHPDQAEAIVSGHYPSGPL